MKAGQHFFFKRVSFLAQGFPLSLELRPGSEAIVVNSEELGQSFIECVAGLRSPRRGKLRLGGLSPENSPYLRSRIGSVFPLEPTLNIKGSLDSWLQEVLRTRESLSSQKAVQLDDLSLITVLREREVKSLTPKERRRVALSLALSLEDPLALFLYDPLRDLDCSELEFTLSLLKKRALAGCIVSYVVPTHREASRLADRVHSLSPSPRQASSSSLHYLVRSERPRELASLLASDESILSTSFDLRRPTQLLVEVTDQEKAATAIARSLVQSQSEVFEMLQIPVSPRPTTGSLP